MCLVICIFAAVISFIVWYCSSKARKLYVSSLCYMFGAASLMWIVDYIVEFIEEGVAIFSPSIEEIINDSLLGISVIGLGLIIWVIIILIKDPYNLIRKKNSNE